MAEKDNLILQDPVPDQPLERQLTETEIDKNEQAPQVEAGTEQTETDFAIQLVETLISLNNDEISSYEAINRFTTKAELSCLIIFARSIPLSPIAAVYPENAFLIFKGVAVPKSVNLTQEKLTEIEERIMASNDITNDNLHLLDLPPEMLNAFEIAVTIYNGKAEKIRTSYLAAVKNAKSQVIEVSAAAVCVAIIIITATALLVN
jgi:hypothetical protein|tara:strand:+ start:37 stop:651 length:615 start_codon:yes stop_codon:yes gene_type:complete